MNTAGQVLLIDDDETICELVAEGLRARNYQVEWQTTLQAGLPRALEGSFDVVLTDLQLGDGSGLELCERVATNRPDVPVVVVTAHGSLDSAIAAIRLGAYDYITKPVDLHQLVLTVERALRHRALSDEVRRLRDTPGAPKDGPWEMIGESPAIRAVRDLVTRVAETDASVLISGESGTGKELVARAIHRRGARADGPFVALNCAALPSTLLESELFGHVQGAFTDARKRREGLFLRSCGGTLLLDEIGELPLEMQPALLRALQEGRVRPVGGDEEKAFDTRLICATNRDLDDDVESGRFREDLFYRINVVCIRVPPLRARGNDVLLLAQYFLQRLVKKLKKPVQGIAAAAAERLLAYDWPGNVRELENCIERAVSLTPFQELSVEDLPEKIRAYRATDIVITGMDPQELPTLDTLERRYIQRVLQAVGGNKTQAAQILGFDRRTLYRKLERFDR